MSSFSVAAILGLSNDVKVEKDEALPQVAPKNRLRRSRTSFGEEALKKLEEVFQTNPYPDIYTRERLGIQLSISESRIQVWFQNRRSRGRRNKVRGVTKQSTSPDMSTPKPTLDLPSHKSPVSHLHQFLPSHYHRHVSYGYQYHPAYMMSTYMMPSTAYGLSPIPYGASNYGYYPTPYNSFHFNQAYGHYPRPQTNSNTVSDQVKMNGENSCGSPINDKLNGINMLTEAARKLSSGSLNDVMDLELRHTEAMSDNSYVDSFSKSIYSSSDEEDDDDSKLCIDLSQ